MSGTDGEVGTQPLRLQFRRAPWYIESIPKTSPNTLNILQQAGIKGLIWSYSWFFYYLTLWHSGIKTTKLFISVPFPGPRAQTSRQSPICQRYWPAGYWPAGFVTAALSSACLLIIPAQEKEYGKAWCLKKSVILKVGHYFIWISNILAFAVWFHSSLIIVIATTNI